MLSVIAQPIRLDCAVRVTVSRGERPSATCRLRSDLRSAAPSYMRLPSRGSANVILPRDRISNLYENRPAPDLFQYFHDHRLVRPPEISPVSPDRGDRGELADRLRGVLFPGSRTPHRLRPVHRLPTENHPGINHAVRVYRLRVGLSYRRDHLELRRGLSLPNGSRRVCLLGTIGRAEAIASRCHLRKEPTASRHLPSPASLLSLIP